MARPQKIDTTAHAERITKALKKTLEAFFEGHDIDAARRMEYLKVYIESEEPPPTLKARKPTPSRVKFTSERDIDRMWANHERAERRKPSA